MWVLMGCLTPFISQSKQCGVTDKLNDKSIQLFKLPDERGELLSHAV